MKKIFYILFSAVVLLTATSCDDFLDTSSPSVVDRDFVFSNPVTSRAAMEGVYESWRAAAQATIFGDGLFYGSEVTGSDIERHPEAFLNQPGRHYPENLYQNGSYAGIYGLTSYMKDVGGDYSAIYDAIGKANAVINAIEATSMYAEMIAGGVPTELSQLYGEAVAVRACCYRELIHYFGDVPFAIQSGVAANGLTSRDYIYDIILEQLKLVEPLMNRVGDVQKNYFSRTAVQALIGRIALDAGGYQTRRTDLGADFYKNGAGSVLTFDKLGSPNNNSEYGRRSDWQSFYATAKTYFKACIDNSGAAVFRDTDPRANAGGKVFENPYQYFFQQMNNLAFADESIYEYAMTQGGGNDARPYSMGRPSSGGGSNAYPCKSYGQARINPAYFYGMYDPKDKRRDVSICVTGSDGNGAEKLIPMGPGSVSNGGGLSLNKWDECRMASPYVQAQRKSGINGPYIRLAEVYLGYAEACAATGDDGEARTYLRKIRERSFPAGQANTEAFIAACGSTLKAVIQERGFEFAGEGDRRWTLIRTGLLPEAIRNIKEMTKAMIDGLSANGQYTFANGNTISNYVWTKVVDAKASHGYRLTTECPSDKIDDPVLYPGWRGQNDDWAAVAAKVGAATANLKAGDMTNLAIKGLFNYIDPAGAEAAALVANGYKQEAWGTDLVKYADEYYKYLFYDYDYQKAPIYLWPFTANVMITGGFLNGYGFRQE
jgi:hypothetical protein